MQSVTKIALASLALLGSVAAVAPAADAQGYGRYGQPYGYQDQGVYNQYGQHYVCGRNLANVVNLIIDPATGRRITQAEYQARYPWTDTTTWTYDCGSNLWTDHTPQGGYYQQSQNYGHYSQGDHYRR